MFLIFFLQRIKLVRGDDKFIFKERGRGVVLVIAGIDKDETITHVSFQPQTTLGFVDEVAILNHIDSYYDEVVILNHILPYYYPRQPQNHMFPASPHSDIMHDILMNNPGDAFSESSSIVSGLGLEDMHHVLGQNTSRNSDSGLSEETILEHLQVITPKAKFGGENKGQKEEVDTCAICYGEYEENKKIGKLQCGHLFHVDCIKSWLSRKNSCPMCRAVALTL
nr:hypothetical protein [Tanacetum cinerariifolium]